ncbi:hypothetical protein DSECCO2_45230 [anaerobic digester metagenome]|jgi:hypothetical protein
MNQKAGRQAQAVPATGGSNYVKQIAILSLALLLLGALSLLHGSGPAASRTTLLPPDGAQTPAARSRTSGALAPLLRSIALHPRPSFVATRALRCFGSCSKTLPRLLKLLPFRQSHPSASRPLAPAVLGLRSSRSVANLIPPEMNTI